MNTQNYIHISKTLSYLLRHDKTAPVEDGGWLSVDYITQYKGLAKDEIFLIVRKDAKKRFELNGNATKVRALYGHSLKVNLSYDCKTPPEILYHGTTLDTSISILSTGLIPKSYRFVHLSTDKITARAVGSRRGVPVVLRIDAAQMHKDGFLFYNPTSHTWLVDRVPSNYIVDLSMYSKKTGIHSCGEHNLERLKSISIICFSREEYVSLTNDPAISDVCDVMMSDIEHPIKIESLEDYFYRKLHIIYNGDQAVPTTALEKISQLRQYTYGVVYATFSPIESNEQYVLLDADDADGRYNNIHKICMLMSNEKWLIPIDYNDIYTCLFANHGQIKILEYLLSADLSEVCGQIQEELACRKFKNCVVHISVPESLEISDSIVYGWVNSLLAVLDPVSYVWGVSYNNVQTRPSAILFFH